MKRYHIIAEGRVQGVGFRAFCQQHATRLRLTGSVRNMENGMVEIYVQGDEEKLQEFLSVIREGNRWILVEDLTIQEVEVQPKERDFRYDFYYGWF